MCLSLQKSRNVVILLCLGLSTGVSDFNSIVDHDQKKQAEILSDNSPTKKNEHAFQELIVNNGHARLGVLYSRSGNTMVKSD